MPQTTTTELLATTLKPHQREGLRKARLALQAHGGVLIADEMGLGKTLVALYLLLRGARVATQSGGVARMLVVVPSAVQLVWLDEFAKHIRRTALRTLKLDVQLYRTGRYESRAARVDAMFADTTRSCICVATYGMVRNDAYVLLRKRLWQYIVFDECHQFKNRDTELHRTLRKYVLPVVRRIGLSGTPNANNPLNDICALSEILFPSLPVLHDPRKYADGVPAVMQAVVVRRTAKQIGLPLPPMHVKTVKLRFRADTLEATTYNTQRETTKDRLKQYLNASTLEAKQRALRAYVCALNLLGKSTTHPQISEVRSGSVAAAHAVQSTKEAYVQRTMNRYVARKEHLIVTAESSTFLNIVHAKNPHTSVLFTGDTSTLDRVQVLRKWRKVHTAPHVLLLSMKAGGVGLTLTEARTIVCVDGLTQPNPAHRAQVIKRIHRMGQTRPVTVYDLCVVNTIDDVMRKVVHPFKTVKANIALGVRGTVRRGAQWWCGIGSRL